MPCPFTGRKMFCASSNFLSQPKKFDCIQCLFKNFFAGTKTNFNECKSSFCLAQYLIKFLVWHRQFGPAQNILGPVKGQGIQFMHIHAIWSYNERWDFPRAGSSLFLPRFSGLTFLRFLGPFFIFSEIFTMQWRSLFFALIFHIFSGIK